MIVRASGGVPPIGYLDQNDKFTYVALVSEILFARTLYHLFQRLVVYIAQLQRRSFCVESNVIEDTQESRTTNEAIPSECVWEPSDRLSSSPPSEGLRTSCLLSVTDGHTIEHRHR